MRRASGACLVLLVALVAGACSAPTSAPIAAAPDLVFPNGAVAADHPAASEAGAAMLRRGGNAVDAAVAASFCLSVVRPFSCGIGGGGFMIVRLPGAGPDGAALEVALDYRESCPERVGPDFYADLPEWASRRGPRACGVPGTVPGLLHALDSWGTLDRRVVLEPAIRAAREGYVVDAEAVRAMEQLRELRAERPELVAPSRELWEGLCGGGTLEVGDVVRNPRQARALELIAERGLDAWADGPLGDAIIAAMEPGGGAISREDLRNYAPRELAPLVGTFAGRRVLAMPPPSSGGIATLQVLGMLERAAIAEFAADETRRAHVTVEAMKHAFADRARWLADDRYVEVPREALLASWYLADRAAAIRDDGVLEPEAYGTGSIETIPEDGGTSHVSVVDQFGGAVACTETINLVWGAAIEAPGFGFALNDEMDDFTTHSGAANAFGLRQSDRNLPEPGKRPLSSMSPTIVLEGDQVRLVAGASGGPRIINGTLQALLAVLLDGHGAAAAVSAPRLHHQWSPDQLELERDWGDRAVRRRLLGLGHRIVVSRGVGVVQVVVVTDRGVEAASDPRKGGRAAGH